MQANAQATDQRKDIYADLEKDPQIKKIARKVPYFSKFQLIDVSLNVQPFKEDTLFANNQFYRENVRNGLSFFQEENVGTNICIRGLPKPFDLRPEYFDILDGTVEIGSTRLSNVDKLQYGSIFKDVLGVFNEGGNIAVYQINEVNGENAQISYNKTHDSWVIAFNNVTIMVGKIEDIQEYKNLGDNRYSTVTTIANTWFNILGKAERIEGIKQELDGKTLVGQYSGNQFFFFALVENEGNRACRAFNETEDFLNKHNLPAIKMKLRRECSNVKEFIEVLQDLTKEVSQNSLEDVQEGSVVYFEQRPKDFQERAQMISSCKVKPIAYRLYKKLGEKIKTMLAREKTVAEQMNEYKDEVEVLSKSYKPSKELNHYYDLAQIAFEFVQGNSAALKGLKLTHRSQEFLDVLKECQAKGVTPSLDHFKRIIDAENPLNEEFDEFEDEEEVEQQYQEKPTIPSDNSSNERKAEQAKRPIYEKPSHNHLNPESVTDY